MESLDQQPATAPAIETPRLPKTPTAPTTAKDDGRVPPRGSILNDECPDLGRPPTPRRGRRSSGLRTGDFCPWPQKWNMAGLWKTPARHLPRALSRCRSCERRGIKGICYKGKSREEKQRVPSLQRLAAAEAGEGPTGQNAGSFHPRRGRGQRASR